MRKGKVFNIIFLFCALTACQTKKDNTNIVLTEFTKDLISMYINDVENIDAKKDKTK